MPAAIAVPAIASVVAGVGGAAIAAHGNSSAAKTQQKSTADALAFSREQEAERKREWEYQQKQAAAAWQARQQMLAPFMAGGYSVLGKYGINTSMPQQPSMPPAPAPRRAVPPQMPGGVPPLSAGAPQVNTGQPSATLGDLMSGSPFQWNDWQRYGVKNNA
jgi:hypothetical protein